MGLLARFVLVGALALGLTASAEAHHQKPEQRQARGEVTTVPQHRPGCNSEYRRERMYVYAKTRYMRRDRPMTEDQNVYIRHIAWCLPTREGSEWAFGKRDQWRTKFRRRLAYQRLTPFVCSNGTRWAIPCYIVYCESHYQWGAYNPSGAAGPYQLMAMHGRPFPVRSRQDKMQHHRIARRLYLSQGTSPWVCA